MERVMRNAAPGRGGTARRGQVRYKTEQAIAELVDNAIGARIQGKAENVRVDLDHTRKEISVVDDGAGMDKDGLERAWALGKGARGPEGRFGGLGIGMKSAAMALGRRIMITTRHLDAEHELVLAQNEERRLKGRGSYWKNTEVVQRSANDSPHGTNVLISDVRVPLYPAQINKFRKEFGRRYGPHIKKNNIHISVNGKQCIPIEPEIEEETKRDIETYIMTNNVRVYGWVALLKKRAAKGSYGIHLYSHGRLMRPYAKFGIHKHPSIARVIGSVTLENVPVNTFKTDFLTESREYAAAERVFREDPTVKEILRESTERTKKNHEIEKILNPPDYPKRTQLAKLGEGESQRLLDGMGTKLIKSDWGLNLRLERDGTGLYHIEKRDGAMEIVVNRKSDVFRAFRNPLHLLVMIQAEAEAFSDDPHMREAIRMRNAMWERRVGNLVGTRPQNGRLRNIDLLERELSGLCEYILKNHKARFQFTALSTLAEFLNSAHKKMVYTIYAAKGTGEELKSVVNRHGKFAVLLDPTYPQLSTAFDVTGDKNIVIIREYASVPNSVVASFEKSWIDLFVETTKKGMPYYRIELEMIETLLSLDMVTKGRVLAWAKRRKIEIPVREYLEVQHSDS